jgi:hypothetical protein
LDAHPLRDLSGAHPGQLQAQGFDRRACCFLLLAEKRLPAEKRPRA